MPNGRCAIHGGKSPRGIERIGMNSPKTKKSSYLPQELLSRYENINGDALDNLEESIKIQQALETRLLEQMQTGESADAWRILGELASVYKHADDGQKEGLFNRMDAVINGGIKSYGVRKEIQNIHQSQGNLTQILTRCRKEIAESFTLEQWNSMMSTLLGIVQVSCDIETQRKIARGIQQAQALPKQLNTGDTNGMVNIDIGQSGDVITVQPIQEEQHNGTDNLH